MDHRINDSAFAAGSTQGGFIYSTSANKDTIGSGQSFAGETIESLSGPPGTAVTLTFTKDKDGKLPLTKAALAKMLSDSFAVSLVPEVKLHAKDIIILLGPNSDGQSALEMTVRCGIEDPRGHQVELELAALVDDRVTGVVPALEADDEVRLLRQEVGDLSFALVAPLRADDRSDRHVFRC